MRKETFYSTLNNIDDRYITEAKEKSRRVIPLGVIKAGFTMAACLCVVLAPIKEAISPTRSGCKRPIRWWR